MLNHKQCAEASTELWVEYLLTATTRLGHQLAEIDNQLAAGIEGVPQSVRSVLEHSKGWITRALDSLPHDAVGDELRRRFAAAYDATIDFSTPNTPALPDASGKCGDQSEATRRREL
jgi:hypothetical protein